jgi:hypothetical protein
MNFTLTERESWQFARLSGDFNPLHVDPVAARRLQFGGTVCHGVHLVLAALDGAVASGLLSPAQIAGIAALFGASVRTGTQVDLAFAVEADGSRLRMAATTEGRPLFTARLTLSGELPPGPMPADAEPDAPQPPQWAEFPSDPALPLPTSSVPLQVNAALMRDMFPALAGAPQGPQIVADLLATTRIVGMSCPGLHSIYSEFKLSRRDPPAVAPATTMPYAVQRADPRFRSVRIGVTGNTMEGTLQAFFRAPPVAQPLLAELRSAVDPQRFAGQRALVVGGSRGLGELVAKLLLAGGAQVTLTYARGQADADRICQEAAALGLAASSLALDLGTDLPPALARHMADAGLTHLYHFATPQIARNATGHWSQRLFEEFCKFYVRGFADVARAAASTASRSRPLSVLYPSTVFLDQPEKGFAEYCAAKAAGEAVCDHLGLEPGLAVFRPRLPRLQTDQNSSFLGVEGAAPLAVMLRVLEDMHPRRVGPGAASGAEQA